MGCVHGALDNLLSPIMKWTVPMPYSYVRGDDTSTIID